MGRSSIIMVAGFIFAFGYLNYSLIHTGSGIVDNLSTTIERTSARDISNSALHYYLRQLSNDRTLGRTAPYTLNVELDGIVAPVSVTIRKISTASPDTFQLSASTEWGQPRTDADGKLVRNTMVSGTTVSFNEVKLPPILAAIQIFGQSVAFNMSGSPAKSHGEDSDTTGYRILGGKMLPAFIVPTSSDSTRLKTAIGTKTGIVSGAGNPPYGVEPVNGGFDIASYVTDISAGAQQTLTATKINQQTDLGTVTNPKITVLAPPQPSNPNTNPSVTISGNASGAGILIVNADFKGSGTLDFKGLVIVIGGNTVSLSTTGSIEIYGALMISSKTTTYSAKGNGSIYYSSQALNLVKKKLSNGRMKILTWWE